MREGKQIITSSGIGLTTRWTGAAVARFASSLVRRDLNEIAPPGQLRRYAFSRFSKEMKTLGSILEVMRWNAPG
jgi:hypothetical protein